MLLLGSRDQAHDPLAGTTLRQPQIYGLVRVATRLEADRIAPRMILNGAANSCGVYDKVCAADAPDFPERQ